MSRKVVIDEKDFCEMIMNMADFVNFCSRHISNEVKQSSESVEISERFEKSILKVRRKAVTV